MVKGWWLSKSIEMTTPSHSRDATATIRGYMYQFDATIRSILKLPAGEHLDVEGIEDFDIGGDDPTDLFQCKYYASKRLTPAELRDAVLPMLKGYLTLDSSARKTRRFHLYGHFKDSSHGVSNPTFQELKAALVQRKRVPRAAGKTQTQVTNLQSTLGATDADLRDFAKKLTIHIGPEYEKHKQETVAALKAEMAATAVEAKEHLYPSALSLVTALATGDSQARRRTTKANFCSQLIPSQTLLSAWLLREMGDSVFCRDMRKRHFSRQNVDAAHRFFIVDCTRPLAKDDLLSLLLALRRKWSSHTVRRKSDAERYAPYIYFRGLCESALIALKSSLQSDGIRFVDGFAFAGASFNAEQVATPQTYANRISLRFLNCEEDMIATLSLVTGQRVIYEFFLDTPLVVDAAVRYTALPVNSIPMIEQII